MPAASHPQTSREYRKREPEHNKRLLNLVERTAIKRIWAHDRWHLASRLLRTVLMHTLVVYTNVALKRPLLHLADLIL